MIFIFEDRLEIKEKGLVVKYVGTSYLLKYVYDNTNILVYFAESNIFLKRTLLKFVSVRKEDEPIILYMDLVADNRSTWGIFCNLIEIVLRNQFRNVYILPIPSIEYSFILSIKDLCHNHDDLVLMQNRGLYRDSELFKKSKYNKDGKKSFEKYTKVILEKCFRQDISKNQVDIGTNNFYNSTTQELNKEITVNEKSWRLWSKLPILKNLESNIYFKTVNLDIIIVIKNLVKIFLKQMELYSTNNYVEDFNSSWFNKHYEEYIAFLESNIRYI